MFARFGARIRAETAHRLQRKNVGHAKFDFIPAIRASMTSCMQKRPRVIWRPRNTPVRENIVILKGENRLKTDKTLLSIRAKYDGFDFDNMEA